MIELSGLLAATGGTLQGAASAHRFTEFSYDSRLLTRRSVASSGPPADDPAGGILGPLFVAVKTDKGDGHDFILDAIEHGATGVLCQRPVNLADRPVTCVVVPDTRAALTAYARCALQRPGLTTVGITGSTGKTTAKELVAAVLARGQRPVFRNLGSINGRYGLSIAAGQLESQHQLAVLELAADSFDEIRDLTELTRPQVGVLTAISGVHLATFGSLEAIAAEKSWLLEALPAQGLAILNADEPRVVALAARTRAAVVTVGESRSAVLQARDLALGPDGLRFTVHHARNAVSGSPFTAYNPVFPPGSTLAVRSSLLGRHHVPLLLAAVATGLWYSILPDEITAALAEFQPLPGRLRPLPGRYGSLILDDTVNASPAAIRAALDVLALFPDRPRVAVLGDMWDLGDQEVISHRRAGREAAMVVDWLVVKGERAQEIAAGALDAGMHSDRLFRAYTDADVMRFLDGLMERLAADHGPVILVKGDRQARMERIVASLLAQPERAGDLLVRQSPGWRQVRPLLQDRPTWVEIDLDAVAGNMQASQAIVGPQVSICAVLKADGYGHGAVGVARTALNNGAHMLAVACLAEAITLRRAAIEAPILVLGYTPAWQARDTLRHDVTTTVFDLDVAQALSQAAADLNRTARVQVKVDTGMGRLGLLSSQVLPFVKQLLALPGLELEGVFTHFSVADSGEPAHRAHTQDQIAAFQDVLAQLHAAGIHLRWVHAANSSAMLTLPESHFNLVRPGIALYGLAPSPAIPLPMGFRPALSWKTQVAQVKVLPPGSSVGYGNTYCTEHETTVAIIPVGYADGFRRSPRHWGHVLLRGRQAPIIGPITMDQTMLDVTGIQGVRQGDEVVLIGRQGDAEITVDQVAERLGTINYEVVAEILARVPRVL